MLVDSRGFSDKHMLYLPSVYIYQVYPSAHSTGDNNILNHTQKHELMTTFPLSLCPLYLLQLWHSPEAYEMTLQLKEFE